MMTVSLNYEFKHYSNILVFCRDGSFSIDLLKEKKSIRYVHHRFAWFASNSAPLIINLLDQSHDFVTGNSRLTCLRVRVRSKVTLPRTLSNQPPLYHTLTFQPRRSISNTSLYFVSHASSAVSCHDTVSSSD